MARLQKEKDGFQEECEKLRERVELQQSQVSKAQRERENMETEYDLIKERWDKAQQVHQKLQVTRLGIIGSCWTS
jgi:chromosome segregation ATPase